MSEWSRVFGNSSSINKAYGADSERQIKKTLDAAFDAPPDYQGIYTPPETEEDEGLYEDMKKKRDKVLEEMGNACANSYNSTYLSALESQVGGDHYKNQGVQPFEITYKNFGYEGLQAAVYTKVNK